MKTIYNLAKIELQSLFCSPVAWLLLVIFALQSSNIFTGSLGFQVTQMANGYELSNITVDVFAGMNGCFNIILEYLYLYMPLLTMGIMSRELATGSIKLLYASPITNKQIILGKYFALIAFCLTFMAIMSVYAIVASFSIVNFDWPLVIGGLVGIYLLLCAYCAIGLFVSTLTSYQVVAAIGTLGILFILNTIGGIGQSIDFVRDITYWLSLEGRVVEMISGLVCSEDILYFIIVTIFFISLSILRLNAIRQKQPWRKSFCQYTIAVVAVLFLGYVSSRPIMRVFFDTTRTGQRTLTQASRDILNKIDDKITITAYTNILGNQTWVATPSMRNKDVDRFKTYTRFKPNIDIKYVYYYDRIPNYMVDNIYSPDMPIEEIVKLEAKKQDLNWKKVLPYDQIDPKYDIKSEGNSFVRVIELGNGRWEYLRVFSDMEIHPSEREISAALKRLTQRMPNVGYVTGVGERNPRTADNKSYSMMHRRSFRQSIINQGYSFRELSLDTPIADDIDVLMIIDPRMLLSPEQSTNLDAYMARGGSLIFAGEPSRREVANAYLQRFNIEMKPGIVIEKNEGYSLDFVTGTTTPATTKFSSYFQNLDVGMPECGALSYGGESDFEVTPMLMSDSKNSGIKRDLAFFNRETSVLDPSKGDVEESCTLAYALTRSVNDHTQKVVVLSDADCMNDEELQAMHMGISVANLQFVTAIFNWMSDGESPVNTFREAPIDNKVTINPDQLKTVRTCLVWIIPLLFAGVALLFLQRRHCK